MRPGREGEGLSRGRSSDFFTFRLAQQPGRFEEEDQNEDSENDGVAVGGVNVSDDKCLKEADQHSAEGCARNIADTPKHGCDERFETGVHSHERINTRLLNGSEDSGSSRKSRAETEGEGDYDVRVY